MKEHHYSTTVQWTGNLGTGTSSYAAYSRNHIITAPGKPEILGSSDPVFRGDKTRYNPEDGLVASLSACHMLSYLHLCAVNKIIVEAYIDEAKGTMEETSDGSARFREVTLYPRVTIRDPSMKEKAIALHHDAHHGCFIAQSVNFPVGHKPEIIISG